MNENLELISRNKGGRPPITTEGITEETILALYRENHSMRKTAKELCIAVRTVFKYVRKSGASYHVGQALAENLFETTNNRKIAVALDALQQPLPRSVVKIAELLHFEYKNSAIQYFLKSRVRAAEDLLRKTGKLLDKKHVILRDIYGRNVQVGSLEMYQLSIDRYNLNVTIEATLKFGGKVVCRISFKNYLNILKGESK